MFKKTSTTFVAALCVASAASAQATNDDCATAAAAPLGATAFDTTLAIDEGVIPFNCAANGGPDIWYSYTATSTDDVAIDLCGSSYDTALEIFDGSCNALNLIECNDDSCGLQSGVTLAGVVPGTTYYARIGGFNGATGFGTIVVNEQTPPPPPAPNCAETTFMNNNGGAAGGAVYFDITVTQSISIAQMQVNTAGLQTSLSVYTTPGTYLGNEANPGAWTQVAEDDGLGIGNGVGTKSQVDFVTPFSLAPGTYGMALVGDNFTTGITMAHSYTNGTGANQNYVSADGVITLDLGAADNAPFAGGAFSPRVWNGIICSSGPIAPGANYCSANANSTGVGASMGASGTNTVSANDLVLEASELPSNSFGFFLTSQTQGSVANPGGSQGNLCLGGAIGRYVGAGQIQNSGSAGEIALPIDNTQVPQPTGLVAVSAGETWSFQAWYRDAVGGSATSNFTDGYEITFN